MKKFIVFFVTSSIITAYVGCYTLFMNSSVNVINSSVSEEKVNSNDDPADNTSETRIYSDKESALLNFIEKKLMGEKGQIYTNSRSKARADDTLSESVGLMMNYCILGNNKDLFDKELDYLNNKLMTADNYIRWMAAKTKTSCNSAIDDFRIVRALLDAYDKWQDEMYLNLADYIQEGIYKKQVKDGDLYELFDWGINKVKKTIPLCYLDLYTMDRLNGLNKNWLAVADKSLNTISNGTMREDSILFYKYYDYERKKYLPDEEYKKDKGICLTYTLYTAMHLAEVNTDTFKFTDWLTGEIEKGKLYAWYDPESLTPVNTVESTAVYALAAIYAKEVGEDGLYHKLMDRMTEFMVNDAESPNYGGFGDERTGDFHSFDNLTALWAFAVE